MNVVIPMAGAGRRFVEAGYDKPKPFIGVGGTPMIVRVMENIGYIGRYHLIHQEEHSKMLVEALSGRGFNYISIPISGITDGAARTVLKAREYIDNDNALLIANSDQLVADPMWLRSGLEYFKLHKAECGVFCFLSDNPKWSYAKVENGRITEIAEKRVISQIATVGVYYFKRGHDFVRAAEAMIAKNIRTNGEFYVAPAINEIIKVGGVVVPYMINEMHGIGTPEDLEAYLDIH